MVSHWAEIEAFKASLKPRDAQAEYLEYLNATPEEVMEILKPMSPFDLAQVKDSTKEVNLAPEGGESGRTGTSTDDT